MIELSPEVVAVLMLGGVLLGVITGYPLAIMIGGVGLIVGYLVMGDTVFDLIYRRMYELLQSYVLLAVPMFVYMGLMLERTGIADSLYDALYLWLGGFRGGLAIITVLIGTLMAACVGIIAASITMLALVALPSMIKRGYDKTLAAGSVCAGGCLGILIPPSVMLVFYGPMATISVGKLFMAAFIPGFILSGLYSSYIALRGLLQPKSAPAVPPEERTVPFYRKTIMLLTALVPPGLLILSVLGVIFLGVAPPTEAAGIGAFVATLMSIAYRKFSWRSLREAVIQTLKISSFCLLIGSMSYAFTGIFIGLGGAEVVEEVILGAPGGRWGSFAVIMFIILILGMFIDWLGILFIMIPILSPLAPALEFDPLWFAMMICVNLQMAFMTPPFAGGIFFLKGAADPELGITMGDIIRGVIPFILLIIVGLGLFVAFPQLILWLPAQMVK